MKKLSVAILGPGSIGKFHVREFHNAGCNVSALLSKTKQSARLKAQILKKEYDIVCTPYHDLETLLSNENLDAVSICTPPSMHSKHVRTCLNAGLHVLCEKPFIQDTEYENHKLAQELVNFANTRQLILSVNTQWPYILPSVSQFANLNNIKSFKMYMEPPIPGPSNLLKEAVPHLNSFLLSFSPNAYISKLRFNTLNIDEVDFSFNYGPCSTNCHLITKKTRPRKFYFTINGLKFQREFDFENGEYIGQRIVHNGKQTQIEDPLRLSIQNFIDTINKKPTQLISQESLLRNVQLQDVILKRFYDVI